MVKLLSKEKRKKRVQAKVRGQKNRPRLSVFRSAKHIYAQLINDEAGRIMVAASDRGLVKSLAGKTKTERAKLVGEQLAQKAKKAKIENVVFDRGSYRYHGRVKALAEGARQEGLKF